MCILFFYVNDDADDNGYRLILASNRDESWTRPTKPASFWGTSPECIGGQDEEPGREGGTWLGISKEGKVAAVLNILDIVNPDKKGRGFLVRNFLTSKLSSSCYLKDIMKHREQYNLFHLVLIDLRPKMSIIDYYSNGDGHHNKSHHLPKGFHSFSNAEYGKCWQKEVAGKQKFIQIVKEHGKKTEKEILITSLIQLLTDSTQHKDDPFMKSQCHKLGRPTEGEIMEQRSAIFVWSPSIQFGTRTNTIILVDKNGHCEYMEKTLRTPVNVKNPEWSTFSTSFQLQLDCGVSLDHSK
ncbi:hypothetical protein ACJMK2_011195 [Sinanodonta woodiana]|uniref:Uncharacterized protein n=1 Tax=Sinanodonta woodiana TaxID=1069815 RepID=A0ABD3V449_SINWO